MSFCVRSGGRARPRHLTPFRKKKNIYMYGQDGFYHTVFNHVLIALLGDGYGQDGHQVCSFALNFVAHAVKGNIDEIKESGQEMLGQIFENLDSELRTKSYAQNSGTTLNVVIAFFVSPHQLVVLSANIGDSKTVMRQNDYLKELSTVHSAGNPDEIIRYNQKYQDDAYPCVYSRRTDLPVWEEDGSQNENSFREICEDCETTHGIQSVTMGGEPGNFHPVLTSPFGRMDHTRTLGFYTIADEIGVDNEPTFLYEVVDVSEGHVQFVIASDGLLDILSPDQVFDEGTYAQNPFWLQQELEKCMVEEMRNCNRHVGEDILQIKDGLPVHDDYSYMLVNVYPPAQKKRTNKKRKRGY